MKITRRSFLSASALALLSCPLAPTASAAKSDSLLAGLFHSEDTALPLKPLTAKGVDANPFMGSSESNIHHDCYNTDSTDAVLPVGICPEVHVAMEKTNPNASPAIFFDNFDNPISPFLGGLAIRDLDAEEVRTIGFFSPAKHDGGGYLIQSSYSFVDGRNLIVCPTSHNHVLMLRATDESGTPLPVFQKVLDINIKEAAERVLGRSLEQNLLSIVFDYDGNLWFVTGGFRISPAAASRARWAISPAQPSTPSLQAAPPTSAARCTSTPPPPARVPKTASPPAGRAQLSSRTSPATCCGQTAA